MDKMIFPSDAEYEVHLSETDPSANKFTVFAVHIKQLQKRLVGQHGHLRRFHRKGRDVETSVLQPQLYEVVWRPVAVCQTDVDGAKSIDECHCDIEHISMV